MAQKITPFLLFPAWEILFNAGRREERGEWNGFRMMPLKHIAVRRWGYMKHRMGGGGGRRKSGPIQSPPLSNEEEEVNAN